MQIEKPLKMTTRSSFNTKMVYKRCTEFMNLKFHLIFAQMINHVA